MDSQQISFLPSKIKSYQIFLLVMWYKFFCGLIDRSKYVKSFMEEVPVIQKPVHWFAEQINRLGSKW